MVSFKTVALFSVCMTCPLMLVGVEVPYYYCIIVNISLSLVVRSLSCVRLFTTPLTAAFQASLSFNISLSLLKLMSIESVMPPNHLILCRPLLLLYSIFPSIRVCSSESVLCSGGPSASAPVFPKNTQGWFSSGLTGLISLLSKGLSRVFSNHSLKASILWHPAFFTV